MTKRSLDSRRASFGQAVIPLSLLALVALVGGLVYHTRTLEASHRATAENALRDYAALAAWQYNQQAESYLISTAHVTLNVVHPWFQANRRPLPPPDTIVKFGDANACGIGSSARFAFRIDLPGRTARFAGTSPEAAARAAIVARFAELGDRAPKARETIRLFVDTVGGAPWAIAYGVALGADSLPRAVFGVEADPSALVSHLAELPGKKALLPPSLLRGRSTDSVLRVEVRRPDGGLLTTIGSASDERLASELTMSADAGALMTRVVVRPQAASMLLIGGVPASRLNTLLLLLVGSIVVAGIALFQIRRGRELARLRTRFVANVSHELRTPLAQISMFSETLLLGRERSQEEGQQFLSIIFREARRLSHLVESVLRFSRADASTDAREFRLEPRDVALEVRDAVRAFTPLAAAAGVEMRTELQDGSVARVEPDALRQVVLNLLDNAVKFGPEGQRVSVTVGRTGTEIVVAVTDEGPGIPLSERRKVFEPFAQGAGSQSRTTTGAGIGLSVVADLVAALGGRVWIEDGPTRGARAAIALPAVETVARVPDAGTPGHDGGAREREAVLTAR
jgi:signal transduction histidine kinase